MNRISQRRREDARFDARMSAADVSAIVDGFQELEPWRTMIEASREDLEAILRQDARVLTLARGEVICREGDHGNSAFVVMTGGARVILPIGGRLTAAEEGRKATRKRGFLSALSQLWTSNTRVPEARAHADITFAGGAGRPGRQVSEHDVPIIVGDLDAVLERTTTLRVTPGEQFGELAAMGRTARGASVVADEEDTRLLEIRWQGIRDLRSGFPSYRKLTDELYRRRALSHQLVRTNLFDGAGAGPDIQLFLESGWIAELFTGGLGYQAAEGASVSGRVGDATIELTQIAESPRHMGLERTRVYSAQLAGELASSQRARATLIRSLPDAESCHTIIVYQGGTPFTIWQCLLGDTSLPLTSRKIVEGEQQGAEGSQQVIQNLIRPLAMREIEKHAEFHTFGDPLLPPDDDPIIVEEGGYPDGLIVVRTGTVRLSRIVNRERRTVSYIGPGHHFGLAEILHNWLGQEPPARYQMTLSAVSSADVVVIPTRLVEHFVLATLPRERWPAPVAAIAPEGVSPLEVLQSDGGLDRSMVEFLVEGRYSNGTSALLIDLDRCTRCDDCVRACAATHDGNPRFVRHGPIQGHLMVANACMHCIDPVCMIGCPTGAISREIQGGYVVINDDTCIGCEACAENCPYDNIRMVAIRDEGGTPWRDQDGTPHLRATKCDLSVEQIGEPACVRACPHEALRRVDLTSTTDLSTWMAEA